MLATFLGFYLQQSRGVNGDLAVEQFRKDVIELSPRRVLILIGTNDLGNGRPAQEISADIDKMAALALRYGITPLIASILPVNGVNESNHRITKIKRLNGLLRDIATKGRIPYMGFLSALADTEGDFEMRYTGDGLHPKFRGNVVMSTLFIPEASCGVE